MDKKYRSYFSINESYFPAVNPDVIRTQPEVWKSYYPHESFIKLLNQTKSVLTNSQRMSIWVEGAYGTGKSHAVLTLKKLLDCSNEELKEYFDRYNSVLSHDLYNDFYSIKNQSKKILTVHRYGSSEVRNDKVLMEYVQESIINALKENGFGYLGQVGIKQAMINWLSDDVNKNYFNSIIGAPEYRIKFNGTTADVILENLKTWTAENAIQELIEKISVVGEDKGIKPFVLQKEDLRTWILDVIDKNNLKAIFFIWDEFSDYFDSNNGNLSGFQFLAEMSETQPFYLCIVTHKSDIFFENTKDDVKTKINGRFISPHCSIELPDNMAFILTAHAMQKVDDPQIQKEWNEIVDDLYDLTHDSRGEVIKTAKIGEKELKGVLPIHPYAALVLKHIASAFDSNQRSMFDFIKNDRGDDIKGFQWFIDNCGPDDDETLLTVDFLWDFFYEKGKDYLAPQIRQILDVYGRTESHHLMRNQERVLKTILLLQAINEKVGDAVSLFVPNKKNLGMAFEGTDITPGNADSLAQSLVKEQIIFERPMGGGAMKYSALVSSGNQEEIEKEKERIKREVRTDKLLEEGEFANDFKLPAYLAIRYPVVRLLTYENIKMTVAQLKNDSNNHPTRLYVAYTFARNQEESNKIRTEIEKTFNEGFEKIVFVDYSQNYLSDDLFNQYVENMANCNYQKGKDAGQSRTYDRNAKEALRRWKTQTRATTPRVFRFTDKIGTICSSESEVFTLLKEFDRDHFEYAVETYVTVIDNMYMTTALKQGAECGITGEIKGTFKSANENTKLDRQFAGVWQVENYWIDRPNELLSKVKIAVESVIKAKLDTNTRVSIADIYDVLTDAPFGYMPCNLSAFILGFVLREYANDAYNWTDDLTTVPMSVDKLKEMIDEIIKQQQTPSPKYRNKYIVAMSPEQREFNKITAKVFNIPEATCTSVENTRSRVRSEMTAYRFPIWTLKLCNFNTYNSAEDVNKLIDLCQEKRLACKVNICKSYLPSLTSKNTEFRDYFAKKGIDVVDEKRLDSLIHDGKDDYDFDKNKLPIHMVEEFKIINECLDNIRKNIKSQFIKKAVIISDHGATRLAILNTDMVKEEVESIGEHGGRVCKEVPGMVKIPNAIIEDGYCVLADYNAIKGGRVGKVEMHGGATLEEVTIPIIEITDQVDNIEIKVLEEVIKVSFKKKAILHFYSSKKMTDVTVKVNGKSYLAFSDDKSNFTVELSDIQKSGVYKFEVWENAEIRSTDNEFKIEKESAKTNDLWE